MATVMLDAGHGGFDNGAMFNGRKEKDDNLSLTLKVGQELEDRGVNVIIRERKIFTRVQTRKQVSQTGVMPTILYHFTEIQARCLIHIQAFRRLCIQQREYRLLWHKI